MPGANDNNLLLTLETQRVGKGEIAAAGTELEQVAASAGKAAGELTALSGAATNVDQLGGSMEKAVATLKYFDISANAVSKGGLKQIAVAARDVDNATAILQKLGSTAVVVSKEMAESGAAATASGAATAAASAGVAVAKETEAAATQDASAKSVAAQKQVGDAALNELAAINEAVVGITSAKQKEAAELTKAAAALRMNGDAAGKNAAQIEKIPGSARTAANAMSILAISAVTGSGSLNGMIIASGGLITGLLSLSKNASIAASASGIGALVTVIGVAIGALHALNTETKASEFFADNVKNLDTPQRVTAAIKAAQDQQRQAQGAIEKEGSTGILDALSRLRTEGMSGLANATRDILGISSPAVRQYEEATDKLRLLQAQSVAVTQAEINRNVALKDQYTAQIRNNAASIAEVQIQREAQEAINSHRTSMGADVAIRDVEIETIKAKQQAALGELDAEFKLHRANGESIPLTGAQIAAKEKLTKQINAQTREQIQLVYATRAYITTQAELQDQLDRAGDYSVGGKGNVEDALSARLNQIGIERDAAIQSGVDQDVATKRAQTSIRAEYVKTANAARDNAKGITSVLQASSNETVKHIGNALETVRRIELGYEATYATIQALKYGAMAVGFAAQLRFGQAAVAGASALQWGAVAAKAAQESMGGGSAGGGGGGAGGSGSSGGTFTPDASATSGGSSLTVQIITRNPYGRDSIRETMFQLDRSNLLNRVGASVYPTTGADVRQVA